MNISDVAFSEGRRLSVDPNICAVGYGAKLRGGHPVGGDCVVFYVREKLHAAAEIASRGSWAVPPTVEGFTTDVVEIGNLARATADRTPPAGGRGTHVAMPLLGGASTMGLGPQLPGPGGYGTVGSLCFDSVTQAPLLLSNAHVWGTTVGGDVAQPVTASGIFGAASTLAATGTAQSPQTVLTRIPTALAAPIVFASSVAQTYMIAGADADPLPFGQAATTVTATTRTDSELVTIGAPTAAFAPAGRRLSPVVSWTYQRFANTATLQATANTARTPSKLLTARRLFTNAASYTAGQTVNLYAEVIPAPGGAAVTANAHFPIAFLYPLPAGDKFIPRLLRPTARQTPTTITTQFTGFPAPSRVGAVTLPFSVAGGFTVDSAGVGTFQAANAGTLAAGTLALKLPVGSVRLFVSPSTQVILDIDLRTFTGTLVAQGVSSAGDNTGTTTIPAPQASGRTLVTISGSEIVEVGLTIAGTAVLYGVTSKRASPETAPPLSYGASIPVSSLSSGQWAGSLFVQTVDGGITESANVVERAIGQAALIADCLFSVA